MPADDPHDRFQEDLLSWSQEHLRDFPWRRPDATPYEVLIAEMFLNVTRTDVVAKVYPAFLERFPDAGALDQADREEIIDIIRPIGLYNTRADALKEIAARLSEEGFPQDEEALRDLPRVGEYVAGAVRSMAFGEDATMMDRNIARVFSRVFGHDFNQDAPEREAWELAEEMLPAGQAARWNLALIDFASDLCLAINPRCEHCFARDYCMYFQDRSLEGPEDPSTARP